MSYPYCLFASNLNHAPVFSGMKGDPFLADLSPASLLLKGIDVADQMALQKALSERMGTRYQWGLAAYLERRDSLLEGYPQMVAEKRFFHLGLDIIVPLGMSLCAPLDAEVVEAGYESGDGNYGGFVLLEHTLPGSDLFYSLYGHLDRERLPALSTRLSAGENFAFIGDFHTNGNWFHHTHLQIVTRKGLAQGYLSKGYCAAQDLGAIQDLCPSPIPLFKR